MPSLSTAAIVCAVRHHGEHGAIARLLTPDHGLVPGYVRGGRSRAMRPILLPGNAVKADFRARTEDQLAGLTVELAHSRAPLHAEPLPAAAIDWSCALTAAALPEEQAYPALHQALDGLLDAVEAAPAARGWAVALVRYELLLLAELGFGLDLTRCAATDKAQDLAFVSPRSAAAVSRAGAVGYESRLLPLPAFLIEGGMGDWGQILDGLRLTGFFLERSVLTDRRADVLAARERLVERLKRAVA
ncbi:DNA repair protein RecO [Sphingobium sp. C100]|jgi:DNA repair protein RecO (recombination protein O)|uniref:DNA repair protein RecO n=1 Tax=Sphingobium sp. C100 TaxID=1207055 RepID=UPI0003D617A5|nr:DNA repair protein RecO [Sphingobium sp. C100]ETI63899.1 DNA repair protein RecO [Sphingobium sp. C100]